MTFLEQVKADRKRGTLGPWVYRPHKYDDWGLVRGGDDYPVASASICRSDDLDAHRIARTDPAYHNAARIARVPDIEAAYIATREAADALADDIQAEFETVGVSARLMSVLAAYRKAVEAQG